MDSVLNSIPVRPLNRLRAAALFAATALTAAMTARGAVSFYDWYGPDATLGGSGTWDASSLYWKLSGTSVAWPNAAATNAWAVFGGAAGANTVTVANGATLNANGLWFKTNYTLTPGNASSRLNFVGTAPTIQVDSGSVATLGVLTTGTSVALTGSGTLQLGANNVFSSTTGLSIDGGTTFNLNGYSDSTGAITLVNGTIQGAGTLTGTSYNLQSGTVSSILAGTGTLTKSTAGTVTITSDNTYTGATNVNAGVLVLQSAGALGTAANTANTTVANGATLTLANGITTTNAGTLVLNGAGTGSGALQSVGANNTWNGSINLAADTTVYSATAAKVLYLNSDYTSAHTLTLGSHTLTIDGPGDTWANANAGVAGDTGGLIKNGTGKLTLYGYNTFYTGPTVVNAGSLDLIVGPFTAGWYGVNGPLTIGTGPANPALAGTVAVNIATNSYASQISPASAVTINSDGILNVGASTGTGSLTLNGGQVSLSSGVVLSPSGAITANANSAHLTSSITGGSLALAASANINVARDATLTSDLTLGSSLTGTGTLSKTGAGILTLSGANTYTGTTTINGGTLALTGSLANSAISVNNASTFAGNGTAAGTVTVNSGGILSPGNAGIGVLTTGAQIWNGGGSLKWEINNATGAAGTAWDRIADTGALTINASAGSKFLIQIMGLNGLGNPGAIANFNNTQAYTWSILSAAGAINNFSANSFQLDGSQFALYNSLAGGSFSVAQVAGGLNLVFTPIPEPRVYALLFGACTLGFVGYRRWRNHSSTTGLRA